MQRLHASNQHGVVRAWHSERAISCDALVYPLFVTDNDDAVEDITALPMQQRLGVNKLIEFVRPLVAKGLRSVLLFGVPSNVAAKDNEGSSALDSNGPVQRAIRELRSHFPQLLVMCDVCLCAYTSHGHCGLLNERGELDNDSSIQQLAKVAVSYAQAGCHVVAPSDMMDNRVQAIKRGLAAAGLHNIPVMSYSAKFASAYYGPFRDATNCSSEFGDRKCYQLPPNSRLLARRAILRDIEEGADMIIVKPGYPYLDIVHDAKFVLNVHVPVAVYQVSGEYAMLYHAAVSHQAFDLRNAVMESLEGCLRAGASIVITYWTPQVLQWLEDDRMQDKQVK
ncbi:Aminolevulinate dehydratase [Sorochytrium milnesiophthora]